jgi:hypothetical protein
MVSSPGDMTGYDKMAEPARHKRALIAGWVGRSPQKSNDGTFLSIDQHVHSGRHGVHTVFVVLRIVNEFIFLWVEKDKPINKRKYAASVGTHTPPMIV